MSTQQPLEELLVNLQTQGDLLDMLASSTLSSEAFLRYRRKQNLLLMRSREQLIQAEDEMQTPISGSDIAEDNSPEPTVVSLSHPPRKRANRRARRPTKPGSRQPASLQLQQAWRVPRSSIRLTLRS